MILDSKSAESHNPFPNGMSAAADQYHSDNTATSFTPAQLASLEMDAGPSNAPPAYTQDLETTDVTNEKNSSPRQPDTYQPVPTSSTTVSSHPYAILPSNASPKEPFSRHAPQQPYPDFQPTFLIAAGQYLTRGFPPAPPPSGDVPHPFASHDVTESDWLRFLQEIKTAGELTERQEQWARLPIVSIVPIVGSVSTHIIRQQMKKGRSKDVANVINTWNHHFFNPRHMEVVLMHGMTRLSGMDKHPESHSRSTPGWSSISNVQTVADDTDKGKGRAKEEGNTYRLFVMPSYTHTP